jgi:hypothetical protein
MNAFIDDSAEGGARAEPEVGREEEERPYAATDEEFWSSLMTGGVDYPPDYTDGGREGGATSSAIVILGGLDWFSDASLAWGGDADYADGADGYVDGGALFGAEGLSQFVGGEDDAEVDVVNAEGGLGRFVADGAGESDAGESDADGGLESFVGGFGHEDAEGLEEAEGGLEGFVDAAGGGMSKLLKVKSALLERPGSHPIKKLKTVRFGSPPLKMAKK